MRKEIIEKYALDVTVNMLDRLDQITQLENIGNGWNPDKFISFDPVNDDTWKMNFYSSEEHIFFTRESAGSKYFKMV